jgi:hypothetical protein
MAVNSRIEIDLTFTGPKVIRIGWEDHVILVLSFFSIAPTVSKPYVQGGF